MLTSSAVDRRLKTLSGQTKDYQTGIAAFLLSMQYSGVRARTGFAAFLLSMQYSGVRARTGFLRMTLQI